MAPESTREGARSIAGLEPTLAALDESKLKRPHTDPQASAGTALLVADYVRDDELGRYARALLFLIERLQGDYLPDAKSAPGELVQRAYGLRNALAGTLDKKLGNDASVVEWLEVIRLGSGVVDLVYDLRTLGDLASHHLENEGDRAALEASISAARTAADGLEFALRAGESPEQAKARNTIARVWTLFVPAYERAAALGRAQTRQAGREREFPPLAVIASRRRSRRKRISVMPPPPAPSTRDDVSSVREVVRSDPPPPPPPPPSQRDMTGPTSWNESRRAPRALVELEVGIASESNFYIGLTENISAGGVFVATYASKPIGAKVDVALSFANGEEIRLPGIVRWTREASAGGWPGMGVQFERLTPDDEAKIRRFIKLRDPLFFED